MFWLLRRTCYFVSFLMFLVYLLFIVVDYVTFPSSSIIRILKTIESVIYFWSWIIPKSELFWSVRSWFSIGIFWTVDENAFLIIIWFPTWHFSPCTGKGISYSWICLLRKFNWFKSNLTWTFWYYPIYLISFLWLKVNFTDKCSFVFL